jgi:hypothetical protein
MKRKNVALLLLLMAAVLWVITDCMGDDNRPAHNPNDDALLTEPFTLTLYVGQGYSDAEKAIHTLTVPVYERKNDHTHESLAYLAAVDGITYDGVGYFSVKVRLRKPEANMEYSLVPLANADDKTVARFVGKTKAELQQALMINTNGQWGSERDAISRLRSYMPFWGETTWLTEDAAGKPAGGSSGRIRMIRTLARLDVGLDWHEGDRTTVSAFYGLPGYEVEEVHLFRIPDKAFVMPVEVYYTDPEVTRPSVPATAVLQHLGESSGEVDEGVLYTETADDDKSINEMYLPENKNIDADRETALVVGIRQVESGKLSYYRLSMEKDANGSIRPILRNQRYIFSITRILSSGSHTPEGALHSTQHTADYTIMTRNMSAD